MNLLMVGKFLACPFCNQNLDSNEKPRYRLVKYDLCCESPDIVNDESCVVCCSCGIVQGYESSVEYVNFHLNKHKMKRKSVYHREHHINNVLLHLSAKYKINLSFDQKNRIIRVLHEIEKILPDVNGNRKRMISINFIMRKIFKMMGIPYDKIPTTTSKKTLAF